MLKRVVILAALSLLPSLPAFAFDIQKVVSDKGVEAWLIEDHSNSIVALDFAFKDGAASDPDAKAGLSNMVSGLLDEGAGDLDSQAFHGKLEDLAISLSFSAGQDAVRGHVKTVTQNAQTAFDLLALSLSKPRFDGDAVERIRGQVLAELAHEAQDPNAVAGRTIARQLYPDHPYGRPEEGSAETVKAITAEDLKAYLPHRFAKDRLLVSVVGDMTPAQLKPLLDSSFGTLPETADPITVPEVQAHASGQTTVIRKAIPQSVVLFAQQGLKRSDPDWYAAYVMNYILGGGGFSARLMTEIRVKRGLTYGVSSGLAPYAHGGLIEGGLASRNDKTAEAISLVRKEWARMAEQGVSPQELADAKTYLIGSYPLQMDSTAAIASLLTAIQIDHLGVDYLDRRSAIINALSVDDIKRVARKYLDAKSLDVVVVGDPAGE